MDCAEALAFLRKCFAKSRIQTLLLPQSIPFDPDIDLGLRDRLGLHMEYAVFSAEVANYLRANQLCKLTDQFFCSYLFLQIPGQSQLLTIGPFLSAEVTTEQLLEQAQKSGLGSRWFRMMEDYYRALPVMLPGSPLIGVLEVFMEEQFDREWSVVDINHEISSAASPIFKDQEPTPHEHTLWNMQQLERRYFFENELMSAISQGKIHQAQQLIRHFTDHTLARRLADPVRNQKNYCIILNTLSRKAAEQGGVHPLYLDRISSEFAQEIESLPSTEAAAELGSRMVTSYCSLVSRHALKGYSPQIKKAIVYIDSNLTGDLLLRNVAQALNISATYLSSLFRKETGMTLTEFVNQKRIKRAVRLLGTTNLQIQVIAQHCGIPDVNYFSKLFKKYTGTNPNSYRRSIPD